jgi:hypothetical protein
MFKFLIVFLASISLQVRAENCPDDIDIYGSHANIYASQLEPKQVDRLYPKLQKWHQTEHINLYECDASERKKLKAQDFRRQFTLQPTDCRRKTNRVEVFAHQYAIVPVAVYGIDEEGRLTCAKAKAEKTSKPFNNIAYSPRQTMNKTTNDRGKSLSFYLIQPLDHSARTQIVIVATHISEPLRQLIENLNRSVMGNRFETLLITNRNSDLGRMVLNLFEQQIFLNQTGLPRPMDGLCRV